MITGRDSLRRAIRQGVRGARIADVYTRMDMRALRQGRMQGINALLADESLVREARAYGGARVYSEEMGERAEAVFAALFVDRSPVSARAQAALWSMMKLGLDPSERNFSDLRRTYAKYPPGARLADALDLASLAAVAVRVPITEIVDQPPSALDERLYASLDLDLLADGNAAWQWLNAHGCRTHEEARALIIDRATRADAKSIVVSGEMHGGLWTECVLPAAEVLDLPILRVDQLPVSLPGADALAGRFLAEGFSFRPYCSAATAPEQLPGLWQHARRQLEYALLSAYLPLIKGGWRLSEAEIQHDIEQILGA